MSFTEWLYCHTSVGFVGVTKVNWKSGRGPCNGNHLVLIKHITQCLASEICRRGRAGAGRVSHVTLRKIVMPDVKEHVRAASQTADCYTGV